MSKQSRESDPPAVSGGLSDHKMLARFEKIVELAPIGIGIVAADGTSWLTNHALSAMLGYSSEELARLPFESYTHPDDHERNRELFEELIAGERDGFEMNKRFLHRDGHQVWGRLLVSRLDDGEGPMAIGLLQDITEEIRLREELERLAFQDPLTQLANRRLLTDRVDHHLRRLRRDSARLGALLIADLNDFKTLNDTLGHQAGDDVLRAVGERISSGLRPSDTPSRLGGDEFAVLLEDVENVNAVWIVAERLLSRISAPLPVVGHVVVPSVSLGFTLLTSEHTLDRALTEADLAMYAAKDSDHDIMAFTPNMYDAARRRFERFRHRASRATGVGRRADAEPHTT